MLRTYYTSESSHKEFDHFHDVFKGNGRRFALDKIGIIQFILFKHPLYERTFLEDVKFKYTRPDGSKFELIYQENRDGYDPKNEERLWKLLNAILEEYLSDRSLRFGIGNSGGSDSRFILYIASKLKANVYPYTIGNAPSDALYIANAVTEKLGLSNHHYPVHADYLKLFGEEMISKRPMHSFSNCWWLCAREGLPPLDFNLCGFNAGNMRGAHISPGLRKIMDTDALYKYIYGNRHVRTVHDPTLEPMLKEKSLLQDSYNDFVMNIKTSRHRRPENIFDEFDFFNRQLRFIRMVPAFDFLDRLAWKSPYFHQAFVDFATQLTYEERLDSILFRNTARRFMKELNSIRFERTPFCMNDRNRIVRRLKRELWERDQRYSLRLYFKGSHKPFNNKCLSMDNYEYIKRTFEKPNEIFDSIFDHAYLVSHLEELIEHRYELILNLLPVKMWMDKYKHYLRCE